MHVLFYHFNKDIFGIQNFMEVQDKIMEVQEEFVFKARGEISLIKQDVSFYTPWLPLAP